MLRSTSLSLGLLAVSACVSPRSMPGHGSDAATGDVGVADHGGVTPDAGGDARDASRDGPRDAAPPEPPPAVYTTTNNIDGNSVLAYQRAADGSLSNPSFYGTGGLGSEDLFDTSQGALAYDPAQRVFVAVNTGDDTIAMLSLETSGALTLLANVPSGGVDPKSVTIHGDLVYVLNGGRATDASNVPGNIAGFRISGTNLLPVPGGIQPLSTPNQTGPAQIQFTPDGAILVVTERGTSIIDTYLVDSSGVAGAPRSQKSSGVTPYGFGFSAGGQLIVSEAHKGMINLSSMSSYSIEPDGTLVPITKALGTNQSDDCWIAIAGPYAYGTNTKPSDNITGVTVSPTGALTLLNADGITGVTGQGCTDEAITPDSQYLYNINAIDDSISSFRIRPNGSLEKLADYTGLPGLAAGLVAR